MFDLSFVELMVVGVVALIVIGPEKLPKVARTLGALTGRVQRYVAQFKEEVNREARFEELQALQDEIKEGVNKTQAAMQAEVSEVAAAFTSVDKKMKPVDVPAQAKPAKKPRKKRRVNKASDAD